MTVVLSTGKRVLPGDIVYSGISSCSDWDRVSGGDGCRVCLIASANPSDLTERQQIVSTRVGVVQWSGGTVSVLHTHKRTRDSTSVLMIFNEPSDTTVPSVLAESTTVFGPQLGDTVHMRVVRVSRTFAYGEIIAVNGIWCSNSNVNIGMAGAFRGVVRVEDIRPFKPTKDRITPPPPSASFQAGDVVIATVLSQSDVRQYQLGTIPEHCGVVEAFTTMDRVRVKLQHIPGRRDAMRNLNDGTIHYRWCPLIYPELA